MVKLSLTFTTTSTTVLNRGGMGTRRLPGSGRVKVKVKVKRSIAVSGNHLTATGNHMPYGRYCTTQHYPAGYYFKIRLDPDPGNLSHFLRLNYT